MLEQLTALYQVIYEGIGLPMGEWIMGNTDVRNFIWKVIDSIFDIFRESPSVEFAGMFDSYQTSVDLMASLISYGICLTMIIVCFVFMYKVFKQLVKCVASW